MPKKSVMVAGRYAVQISDLRRFPPNLTEHDLAKFLGISESHARRRRTGKEYEGQPWPEHHRSATGRGQVVFCREKLKTFLGGCPAC